MSKTLSQLLQGVPVLQTIGDTNVAIDNMQADSRLVTARSLFVAVPGTRVDGHQYISRAVEQGATAVICQTMPDQTAAGVAYVRVADSAEALGIIASHWYGDPSEKLTLVGVTGTNGKTTIATLLYEMARFMGHKAGLLSTVVNLIDGTPFATDHTTPDVLTIHRLMAEMVKAGCTFAAMEVSSHACHQRRIAGLQFAGGIFTNLTRDHLDYHKTVEAYLAAKKSFFDSLPPTAWALTNADDRNGAVMVQNTRARVKTYAVGAPADYRGRLIADTLAGSEMEIDGRDVHTRLSGRFNASNVMAVYGASLLCGWDRDQVLVNISRLHPAAGRFRSVTVPGCGVTAIVDYAHTPDAIVNVLKTLREVVSAPGRIICVTGAGGNRDTGKRPIMAREAYRWADDVILTSDNPRDEDPDAIISMMRAGIPAVLPGKTLVILTDRRAAIRRAVQMARDGDVVAIVGKGHETYQEVKGVKHHFDDVEEAAAALQEMKNVK